MGLMAQSRGHPRVLQLQAPAAPGCRKGPIVSLADPTGAKVSWRFLHQPWALGLSPRGTCPLQGTAGCQQLSLGPRGMQELPAHLTLSAEPRGAGHSPSLAREVTASPASRELPALLSSSALGPGSDGASCSWRRRPSLPGAEPSAWQGQPHLLGRRQKLGNLPAFAAFRLAAAHGGSRSARVFAQRDRR